MTNLLQANDPLSIFISISLFLGTLAMLVSVHESAHAWMANKLGDPTAKHQGRVSLNPIVHIDPIGTVILPLFIILSNVVLNAPFPLFGWAKPTPFNPWNLQNPRRDSALISLAGPASNFVIAIIIAIIYRLLPISNEFVLLYVQFALILTLILGIFNLIPIAPLDGFKVVTGVLPKNLALQWEGLERIGPILLIAIIFFGSSFLGPIIFGLLSFFLNILIG